MTDSFGRPLVVDGTYPGGRLACASVIDTALAAKDSASFFAAFSENGFWGGPWSEKLDAMSRDTHMLLITDWLLWTRKHPRSLARHEWFASDGLEFERWLNEIGATDTKRYVRELLDLYPNGAPFRKEVERDRYITTAEKANPDIWRQLGERYPSLEDELAVRLRLLFKKRGTSISSECEALRTRFAEPLPLTLREIVDAPTTDGEFSAAFVDWLNAPTESPKLGFDKQPECGRMLWVLDALARSVLVGGMVHFLHSFGVGRYFPKLAAWAKTVGAPTTVAYAKAVTSELKRLNGGKLPPMLDASRIEVIHALEQQDEAAGGRGLFDALDEEYRVLVVAELAQRLRAYVREHLEEIEREQLAAAASNK